MDVTVTIDQATPAIGAVVELCQPENILPVFGETAAQTMRDNFVMLDENRPNYLGGERSHYYLGAAERTTWRQDDATSVIVSSDQIGLPLRYFGGTVTAGKGLIMCGENAGQPTRFLTIPLTAEAYGKKACDFPGLKVLWGRNGPYALGYITRSGGSETREAIFALKESVDFDPDPTVLPSPMRFTADLKVVFAELVNGVREGVLQAVGERGTEEAVMSALAYGLEKVKRDHAQN